MPSYLSAVGIVLVHCHVAHNTISGSTTRHLRPTYAHFTYFYGYPICRYTWLCICRNFVYQPIRVQVYRYVFTTEIFASLSLREINQ